MASKRSSTTAGLDEGLSQPPSQKMAKVDPDVAVDEQQDKEQDADKAANEREGWDSEEEEALEEEVLAPVLGAAKPRKVSTFLLVVSLQS